MITYLCPKCRAYMVPVSSRSTPATRHYRCVGCGYTSKTEQMPALAEKEIDYAFFCCDGVYNMDLEEAAECAALVKAKHNIPYHMAAADTGVLFDRETAERFNADNRLIISDGEEIVLEY